ncbi:MAG: alpha/beta hydrolase [Oceanicaulis sp.]
MKTWLIGLAAGMALALPAESSAQDSCPPALPSAADIVALELPGAETVSTLFDLAELSQTCPGPDDPAAIDAAARDLMTAEAIDAGDLPVFVAAIERHGERGDLDGALDIFFMLEAFADTGALTAEQWLPIALRMRDIEAGLAPDGSASYAAASLERATRNADAELRSRDLPTAAMIEPDHVIVPVFYGTNRARTGSDNPLEFYGHERAPLQLGVVEVSVPRNREIGEIRRTDRWQGDLSALRGRYFIIDRVEPIYSEEGFAHYLDLVMDQSERRELLVFIHGYNTDFRSAAERAAQLAVDLEIDGAPALYSWPSRGTTLGYFADSNQVIRPVIDDLRHYLELLMESAGADRIHVVAHSMGNRFLLRALEEMADDNPAPLDEPLFDQVVWASPDVDQADFLYTLPDLLHLSRDMTLYASASDRALRLSRRIQGGYPRAGDVTPSPVVLEGLSTVDTTAAGDSGLGHSDYAGPALDDFRAIVWLSLEPEQRCILEVETGETGLFYRVEPLQGGACAPDVFKYSITALRRAGPDEALNVVEASLTDSRDPGLAGSVDAIRGYIRLLIGAD